jgi:hypothetical protein
MRTQPLARPGIEPATPGPRALLTMLASETRLAPPEFNKYEWQAEFAIPFFTFFETWNLGHRQPHSLVHQIRHQYQPAQQTLIFLDVNMSVRLSRMLFC